MRPLTLARDARDARVLARDARGTRVAARAGTRSGAHAGARVVRWRLAIVGLGHVGSGVLEILSRSADDLRSRYGVEFAVTGVAELGGGAVHPAGLDLAAVLGAVRARRAVAELDLVGRPQLTAVAMIRAARPDIVLEATPVNLRDGEPGLSTVVAALRQRSHVVLANKGPLTLAYPKLSALADVGDLAPACGANGRPRLRFSACVGGALPVVNMGRRDLSGCRILRFEGVLNGTSQSILRAVEDGRSYDEALRDAQERGIAEADPALDVSGLDSACKLVIVANAVLGQPTTLGNVEIRGIQDLDPAEIRDAQSRARRIVLRSLADWRSDSYHLSVGPAELPLDHPLARLHCDEMGAAYTTDTVDRLSAASFEPAALPASAAMLRDVLDIVRIEAPRPMRYRTPRPGRYRTPAPATFARSRGHFR
jgi:homoserine dehydrogenase